MKVESPQNLGCTWNVIERGGEGWVCDVTSSESTSADRENIQLVNNSNHELCE